MSNLQDKVILVTGGTSGIGEACTELFARSGAKVVTSSIQREAGEALAARLVDEGCQCVFQYADVSNESDVEAMVAAAVDRFGRLDAVHANAGVLASKRITDVTVEEFHHLMNVNVLGAVLTTKHAVRVMEKQGSGVIVFTTSVAADIGFPAHAVYAASKAAVAAMIRSLTTDHSPQGIRFAGVSPGTIDTPMLAESCAGFDKPKDELYAEVAQKIPVRRMGTPEDVARTVAFLISDEAGFVNGVIVPVEGGTLCLPPW
ncbi:MAG: SDR family oxidoreductase [Planctomycetota bacterium]|nr:SDR family oxidoreductase [Planctomycetota bacterium]